MVTRFDHRVPPRNDELLLASDVARLFGMSVVIIGTASFAIALGTLLGPLIQACFTKTLGIMSQNDIELLDTPILILGYSNLVGVILNDISDRGEILVVSSDRETVRGLSDRGINALTAPPDDEDALRSAGLDRARTVIVATDDDASDAMTILTVRQLNPDVEILAVATNRENMKKLERAGANSVISPAVIATRRLVQSALDSDTEIDASLLDDHHDDKV